MIKIKRAIALAAVSIITSGACSAAPVTLFEHSLLTPNVQWGSGSPQGYVGSVESYESFLAGEGWTIQGVSYFSFGSPTLLMDSRDPTSFVEFMLTIRLDDRDRPGNVVYTSKTKVLSIENFPNATHFWYSYSRVNLSVAEAVLPVGKLWMAISGITPRSESPSIMTVRNDPSGDGAFTFFDGRNVIGMSFPNNDGDLAVRLSGTVNNNAIPEPSSVVLGGLGILALLASFARRNRRIT